MNVSYVNDQLFFGKNHCLLLTYPGIGNIVIEDNFLLN